MTLTHTLDAVAVPRSREATTGTLQSASLRLRLRTPLTPAGTPWLVDGGWWPYSDDLVAEVQPLLAEMARRGHVVHRISYCLTAWRSTPRKLHVGGTLVRLGGYRTQSPAVIHLIDSSGGSPLVLVVVPPDTAAQVAQAALDLAVGGTSMTPAAVLDAAALSCPPPAR